MKLYALAFVCFFKELIKAPTKLGGAEQNIDKRTNRQQNITNNEVFRIKNIKLADGVNMLPDIITLQAGKTCNKHCNAVYNGCFYARPFPVIHSA